MMQRLIHITSSVLPLCAILFIVMQFVVSNHLVSIGKNTQILDREISKLNEENEVIRQKIASVTSLSYLETKAVELGFVKTVHILSLSPPDVAYNKAQ